MFGVLDVDELLVHRRRVVERGLPAAVHARHRRPDADGAPEVIGHVHGHHVLHAQAKVCGAFDLKEEREFKYFLISVPVDTYKENPKKPSDLHGFDDRVAHLMAVVAHTIHRHVHCQLPRHWLPKGVPA